MIVLGFDPGAWLGWCALAIDASGPRYLDGGVLSVEELGEDAARDQALHYAAALRVDLVVIERVQRVLPTLAFQRGAAQQAGRLVDAAWLGGELAMGSRCAKRQVLVVAADVVRSHFVAPTGPVARGVKKPKMDGVLTSAVEHFVLWPTKIGGYGRAYRKDGSDLMSVRRAHVTDAALLALYAGTVLVPQPAVERPPPAPVEPGRRAVA